MLTLTRGSAHSKAFAAQTHPNRGRVPRFGYFEREKVSAWELSDVRVLRSQNTDCRKNEVFRQTKKARLRRAFRLLFEFLASLAVSSEQLCGARIVCQLEHCGTHQEIVKILLHFSLPLSCGEALFRVPSAHFLFW